jgi:GTP cyclohydrolase I
MSYQLSKIIEHLENWAPLDLAETWDNPGLQIGDIKAEIKSVLITLDIDINVLNHLKNNHSDLIITHHPLFFKPLKQIIEVDVGKIARNFIKSDINLYSAHTNLDIACGGVNDCLIKAYNFAPDNGVNFECGSGKWFANDKDLVMSDFLKCHNGQLVGPDKSKVKKVAFCCGSGKSVLSEAVELGIDLLITGELGYHEILFCELNDISVILLGHKESEIHVLPEIQICLKSKFNNLQTYII